ncbi:MAG: DUF58 domain-containing protein [Firmicutes bacterium]|nr:DUF58 domain-containing protein [Bacillota bacterium]
MINRISFLVFFILIIAFAFLVGGSFPYLLLFIIAIMFIYSYRSVKKINKNLLGIYWSDKDKVEKDEYAEVNYKLYNSGLLPLPYAIVEDGIPERLSKDSQNEKVFFIKPYEAKNIKKKFKCKHRGFYEIGKVKITTGDIFGIIKKEFVIKDDLFITVYPKVYKLENFNIEGKDFYGSLSTNQKHYEDYTSIKNLRKYHYGDSLKRVHWKVTAKKNELIVKNYEVSANAQIRVYMDFELNKFLKDKEGLIEEKVAECVISIIHFFLKEGIESELITYTEKKIEIHGKDSGEFKYFLETLARIRPKSYINMGDIILHQSRILPLGTTIIIVTPKVDRKILSSSLTLKKMGYNLVFVIVGDFKNDKTHNENIEILNKMEIITYKLDIEDNIKHVLR